MCRVNHFFSDQPALSSNPVPDSIPLERTGDSQPLPNMQTCSGVPIPSISSDMEQGQDSQDLEQGGGGNGVQTTAAPVQEEDEMDTQETGEMKDRQGEGERRREVPDLLLQGTAEPFGCLMATVWQGEWKCAMAIYGAVCVMIIGMTEMQK